MPAPPSSPAVQPIYQGLTAAGDNPVLVNDGMIDNTAISFANGGAVVNSGVYGNQAISAATLLNQGTILANNAGATISGTASGGTAEIANCYLTVDGTLSGTAVDFNGPGELTLEQPMGLCVKREWRASLMRW